MPAKANGPCSTAQIPRGRVLEFIDGIVCTVACSIPHLWRAQGYGMYNTCDRAALFGSRVKKRDRLGLYCLTEVLKSGWDAPWYCLRISLAPRPVMRAVAKRPIVSDPFKQASRIAREPLIPRVEAPLSQIKQLPRGVVVWHGNNSPQTQRCK